MNRSAAAALVLGLLAGCSPPDGAAGRCDPPRRTGTLPSALHESSGVAASRRHPGVLWSHNDSGDEPVVFAFDTTGRVLGRVRVTGARNRDWEDLAIGACPGGTCLYIADTGDNSLRRDDAAIYRVPEPAPGDAATQSAERLPIRYPDGPRDVEALYVMPNEDLFLVSKGRSHPVTVYRYLAPADPGAVVEVEEVQRLTRAPMGLSYQVTGAGASPDGRHVAVRTYTGVRLFRPGRGGRLAAFPAGDSRGVDVQLLAEPQGEAVAWLDDGALVLTSEAGPGSVPGPVGRLDCRLD